MNRSENNAQEGSFGIYYPSHNWVAAIFERGYPFEVWEERINNLDIDEPELHHLYGISEALLFLADSYATMLASSLINPSFRWLAMERFASSQLIGFIARLLGTERAEGILEKLSQHAELVSLVPREIGDADSEAILSTLLGNPARINSQGKLDLQYDPELLRDLIARALRFRTENRRLLNAVKHGYRLPMYISEELDVIVSNIRGDKLHSGEVQDASELRIHIEKSGLDPVFWHLQTPQDRKKSGRSTVKMDGNLVLYGISYPRAVDHCNLLLDLLRLLFDMKRGSVALERAATKTGSHPFKDVLSRICWIPLPMKLADDDAERIVRGYVPDERKQNRQAGN